MSCYHREEFHVGVLRSELSCSPNQWWAGPDRPSSTENVCVVFLLLPTDFFIYNLYCFTKQSSQTPTQGHKQERFL